MKAPSQGLATLIVRQVFDVIVTMRKENMSVPLVERNMRTAVPIADRAYMLDNGSARTTAWLPGSPRTKRASRHWPAPMPKLERRRLISRGPEALAGRVPLNPGCPPCPSRLN